jgi:hypothetical protein
MDIEKLFSDKQHLRNEIEFFLSKKHIKVIAGNPELVNSHMKKARHNMVLSTEQKIY